MTTIQKNDFIEIEFTGKSNGEIFDTTNPEEAKQIGLEADVKPFLISIGNEMLLKGLDEDLAGKEIGKKYAVHLTPETAFGKRDASLIKTMPMRVFREKNITPYPGLALQFDNQVAKILSVSGGRVTVDFNNPLAGKDVDYDYKVLRKLEDNNEKINALQDFFFRQRFEFTVKTDEKSKKIKVVFKNHKIQPILKMFSQKLESISGFEFEVEKPKDIIDKKTETKEESEDKDKNNKTK